MTTEKESPIFGNLIKAWHIPSDLSDFESYGLWNSLSAYDQAGKLIAIIPAHDGDFFPESPLDHVELLRKTVLTGKTDRYHFWPVRVDIDITQKCTSNCYFCYSRQYAFNQLYSDAEISAATFEAIIEELAKGGTRSVRFTGGGEPLIHPEIKRMLPLPQHYGLRSCIITNGDLLDKETCELLVANVEHIRISINAAQTSTRQRLNRSTLKVNDLIEIFRHIEYMIQLRNDIWSSKRRPLIWVTFLLLPENVNEIYLAAQIIRDLGVDSISFRPVYHDLSHRFSANELEILKCQLKLASNLHSPPIFQVFTPRRDITVAGHISPAVHFLKCVSCSLRTIIEATNLGPMIKVCGLHRGSGGESLGLMTRGIQFSELWNSHRVKGILSNRTKTCQSCIDVSMNVTLNEVLRVLIEHPKAVFRKSWQRTSLG